MDNTTWPVTVLERKHAVFTRGTSQSVAPRAFKPEVRAPSPASSAKCGHVSLHCASCPSRATTPWNVLGGSPLVGLDCAKSSNVYEAGQNIYYQGNPCLGIYCIESGAVAVRKSDANGNHVILRVGYGGDSLGYRSFFAGQTFEASAVALTTSRVCFIEASAVLRAMAQNPELSQRFLRMMANDLHDANLARLQSMTLSVKARVAQLLLSWKDRFGAMNDDGDLRIELPVARQDMAAMLGTRPETIARVLRTLEDENVAHFDARMVRVPDLDALMDAAELE
jgi:CRP-like cAMP-binding protein